MPAPRYYSASWVERDHGYRWGWWCQAQFYPCGPLTNNPRTAELLFRVKYIEKHFSIVGQLPWSRCKGPHFLGLYWTRTGVMFGKTVVHLCRHHATPGFCSQRPDLFPTEGLLGD